MKSKFSLRAIIVALDTSLISLLVPVMATMKYPEI